MNLGNVLERISTIAPENLNYDVLTTYMYVRTFLFHGVS
jgi:hypothetical protein